MFILFTKVKAIVALCLHCQVAIMGNKDLFSGECIKDSNKDRWICNKNRPPDL